MHNLLTDPIIRFTTRDLVERRGSLPEVYGFLMKDEVESFTALRHYQVHSWHAFLCQLGRMALDRAGFELAPLNPRVWAEVLANMTTKFPRHEPWQLMVQDITKPAFMQPPPGDEDTFAQYKKVLPTPDNMDMMVTAKNHSFKMTIASEASPDDWMFALISEQTMDGVIGLHLRAISRMNGGRSNRPAFSMAPLDGGPGARVRRDINALREFLPNIAREHPEYPKEGGLALLWLETWEGREEEVLSKEHLDPLYIEVCRRIRLTRRPDGTTVALRATAREQRVAFMSGLTGDPWAPVDRRKNDVRSITIPSPPLTLETTIDLLAHEEIDHPHLLTPTRAEVEAGEPMQIIGRIFCRGQGKTLGYHERSITARPALVRALRDRTSQEYARFSDISQARKDIARSVRSTLQNAAQTFMSGGNGRSTDQQHKDISYKAGDRLLAEIAETFFIDLQDELEAQDESQAAQARMEWMGRLSSRARTILQEEMLHLRCPSTMRYKATFAANRYFEGILRTDRTTGPLMRQMMEESQLQGEEPAEPPPAGDEENEVEPQDPEDSQENGEIDESGENGKNGEEGPDPQEETPQDPDGDRIVRTARRIAEIARSKPTELSELRRMDPDEPYGPVFDRLTAQERIMPRGEDKARWGLIIHGMALMTPSGTGGGSQGAHRARRSVGRALYLGGGNQRATPFYSEQNMTHLLSEKGQASRTRLQRVFRVLASDQAKLDWREMAKLILNDGTDEEGAEETRRRIAEDYFTAQRRARR